MHWSYCSLALNQQFGLKFLECTVPHIHIHCKHRRQEQGEGSIHWQSVTYNSLSYKSWLSYQCKIVVISDHRCCHWYVQNVWWSDYKEIHYKEIYYSKMHFLSNFNYEGKYINEIGHRCPCPQIAALISPVYYEWYRILPNMLTLKWKVISVLDEEMASHWTNLTRWGWTHIICGHFY